MDEIQLGVQRESWPIAGKFTISRGSKTTAEVVVVELSAGGKQGRGECVPYARYGETVEDVIEQIESQRADLMSGMDRGALQASLPPGAARNALDCAFWDLEAKTDGKRVWELAGLSDPVLVKTVYTLSLDTVENMAAAAERNADRPLLKLKLAGPDDLDRVRAVRVAAPGAKIVVDANEGWTLEQYVAFAPELADIGVAMIEQPLPAGEDAGLADVKRPVPVCADESCHDTATLSKLAGRYDMINIKLDKTGGLTEALRLKQAARDANMEIMVGCMIATSLSMAPAIVVAQDVAVVDVDGPLLLAKDRPDGLFFDGSLVSPPQPALWG
ncbi:N-acetyl-D-Glu racemase DgcA [Pelagibius sp. Alg239-R121]|uniref:N-acetyl-D-Glu racemase DgcA n=1 Tax=Pelagibius sp. Alg239-R121 TaxID=2993448 RepID=UPI0024A6B4C6|nr:N-acetyl-D-Glu racemase DgcA [Pelagibius sp. Alg239-R121]